MKTVVMIAHNFPPEGNAGAYRPLRFVRHLSSHSWRPIIITLANDCYERFDPRLLDLIPKVASVVRVPHRDPWQALQSWRTKRGRIVIRADQKESGALIQASQHSRMRACLRT